MAAVRRTGGKLAMTTTGPGASAPSRRPKAKPAAPTRMPKPDDPVVPLPLLLDVLEDDRREHDRQSQRARETRRDDEADGAAAVAQYLVGLAARLQAGLTR